MAPGSCKDCELASGASTRAKAQTKRQGQRPRAPEAKAPRQQETTAAGARAKAQTRGQGQRPRAKALWKLMQQQMIYLQEQTGRRPNSIKTIKKQSRTESQQMTTTAEKQG